MKTIAALFLSLFCLAAQAADRPNLLFIMLDDLGVGQCQFNNDNLTIEQFDPYFKELVARKGDYTPEQALEFSKRAMPTLNRLARSGIIFDRAYAASSLCAPSRLAIATGKIPPQAGIYTNMDVENSGLKPGEHLAEHLHNAGYATAHIGKWHVAARDNRMITDAFARHGKKPTYDFWTIRARFPDIWDELWDSGYYGSVPEKQNPLNNGFDVYYGYNNWASQFYDSTLVWNGFDHAGRQSGYNTEVFTDKAIEFINQQDGKPFYLQLHYHAVHDYLEPNAPERYRKNFLSESYNLSNFYAHLYAVDANVQRILNVLEKNGQLDNTLIAFTSDNGAMAGGPNVLPGNAPLSGHKGMLNQGGIRVPLFFHWPKGITNHRRSEALVSSIDILPTFIEAAGLKAPTKIDAKSLLPMLAGANDTPVRDRMVWAGIHATAWGFNSNRSLLGKNAERSKAPGGWAVVQGDYALRFTVTVAPGLYKETPDGAAPKLELFNIRNDVAETTDVKEQFPEVVQRMKDEYSQHAVNFRQPIVWDKDKWSELVK